MIGRRITWSLSGNLAYGVCQWLVLIALARLASPEVLGIFALSLAICAPVFLFTNMGLRTVLATDAGHDRLIREYLACRLLGSVVAAVLIAIGALTFFGKGLLTGAILLVAVAKAIESVSDLAYGAFQRAGRMDRVARSLTIKGITSLIAFVIGFTLGELIGALVGLAAAWLIVLLVYDAPAFSALELDSRLAAPRPRSDLVRVALPLGVTGALGSFIIAAPRYFVEWRLGSAELGVFVALSYFMILASRVSASVGEATSPALADAYQRGDAQACRRLIGRLTIGIAAAGGVLIAGFALFGRFLLQALYGAQYAAHLDVCLILMVAALAGALELMMRYAVSASHRYGLNTPILAIGLGTLLIALPVLTSAYGIVGVALAVLAGESARFLVATSVTWRIYRAKPSTELAVRYG